MPQKVGTQYWLMKTEPSCYSIDDLARQKVGTWDGVRNYQARNFMRAMRKGDVVFIYHSSADVIGIVGVGEVAREAYPDKTQFDLKADHFDPKSTPDNPRWDVVDIRFKKKLARVITLAEIKNDPQLQDMVVAQRGSRLSVQPVSLKHNLRVMELLET